MHRGFSRSGGQAVGGQRIDGQAGRAGTRPPNRPPPRPFARFRSALKQIAGMPDYARYLEHAAEYHPDCPLLSEREYFDHYLAGRYAGGGSRCC